MVFRGKPSKACERCRIRRLRCDLQAGACGQCTRASIPCTGYRDTHQLRIHNESQSVAKRVSKTVPQPRSLPLSLDWQARDAFFAHYATSRCFEFLNPHYNPIDTPKHLTLAIEAVGLAYLWHQVYSDAALATAREKYILALRMTQRALQTPNEAIKPTSLMSSLLLDLFEKITDQRPRYNKSWTSHVDGAIALVQLGGIERFQGPSDLAVLVRLFTHYIVSCVASGSPVPSIVNAIQAFIKTHRNRQDPMLQLSNLMAQYANLRDKVHKKILSDDYFIEMSIELDRNMQALEFDLPPYWHYSTTFLQHKSDRAFDLHYDTYANPKICQARNIIRVLRLLLNEPLLAHHLTSPTSSSQHHQTSINSAQNNLETLTREICASAPQYTDCDDAARSRLPSSSKNSNPPIIQPRDPDHQGNRRTTPKHTHTPSHQLDCYSLIFPLYVVGKCNAIPPVRAWVIRQLEHISRNFGVRNAKLVAGILEQGEEEKEGRDGDVVGVWDIYAMLGSYALAS